MTIGIAFFAGETVVNDFVQWTLGEKNITASEYPSGTSLDFQVPDAPDDEYVQMAKFAVDEASTDGIIVDLEVFDYDENSLGVFSLQTWFQSVNTNIFWADIYYINWQVSNFPGGGDFSFVIDSHS